MAAERACADFAGKPRSRERERESATSETRLITALLDAPLFLYRLRFPLASDKEQRRDECAGGYAHRCAEGKRKTERERESNRGRLRNARRGTTAPLLSIPPLLVRTASRASSLRVAQRSAVRQSGSGSARVGEQGRESTVAFKRKPSQSLFAAAEIRT